MQLDSPPLVAPHNELAETTLANPNAQTPIDLGPRTESVAAPMPDVGEVLLKRWRIVAWLGFGSASIVFRAEHVTLGMPVAIKIVNRQHYPDRAIVIGHLHTEARILARLRHPNLARLWDFHEEGVYPCLVTDFIDGMSMRQTIDLQGRIEPRQAVRAAIQVAETLVAIGREGIVHRDVKPDNVLLCNDGSAKLIDFGLAIDLGVENQVVHSDRFSSPRVGTVAYLAPEQARNSSTVDQRADIYSLGATLYHAVTGRLPFAGNNAAQMMLRHLEDDPFPPRAVVPTLDENLSRLILRMMAKKPGDRFADAEELLGALCELQDQLARH